MEGQQQIAWILVVVLGGIGGWSAEQFKKSQIGVLINILLGMVGASVASDLFDFLGIQFAGWIGYHITGFIGAGIVIALGRAVSDPSGLVRYRSRRRSAMSHYFR